MIEPHIDIAIIGAGVVGLATAFSLKEKFPEFEIMIFEQSKSLGEGISGRNSQVIHSGIYYPQDSLKSRFCIEGNRKLYEFCVKYQIPFRKTGKIIVSADSSTDSKIEWLYKNGTKLRLKDLRLLSPVEISSIEPEIVGTLGIYVESTGVIDVSAFLKRVSSIIIQNNVQVLTNTKVIDIIPDNNQFLLVTSTRGNISARYLINCAGLESDTIANMFGTGITIYPCKGDYFFIGNQKKHLVNMPIYPIPEAHGLGIHLTKMLDDTILCGPDTYFIDSKNDYDLKEKHILEKQEIFFQSIQRFFPKIEKSDLIPGYAGIRPKLKPKEHKDFVDFSIKHDDKFPNCVHALGIESPGLTACLAIGDYIRDMIEL